MKIKLFILSSLFCCVSSIAVAEEIVVTKITGDLPINPQDTLWQQTPVQTIAMLAQQMTMPTLATASIDKLSVQAMHDSNNIVWRVSWADATADGNVDTARFADAVALEFPLDQAAAPMMGNKGGKVQILYWKGLWQKDIDEGFQDVQNLYPNFWSDLYWFAEGEFPYKIPASFKNQFSHQWFIAKQAGNPMSTFERSQPIEELSAEGWGTLTHQKESVTTGKGVWQDGKWIVTFARPLKTDDINDHQFNDKGQIAFAVWQGGDKNVGGRKHWANWVTYQLQP